ncbi:MAG: hypothetical protein ABSE56_08845 [Bryobacteraceae bacterium]|jgi:uncharacterized protein (TIGR02246 family)
MRVFAIFLLAAGAFLARADEAQDRKKIGQALDALKNAQRRGDLKAIAALFTTDSDLRTTAGCIVRGPAAIARALVPEGVWTEVTPPRLDIESVRFPVPGVALVAAVEVQYGSIILKRARPVAILLKKENNAWRIEAYRVAGERVPRAPLEPLSP